MNVPDEVVSYEVLARLQAAADLAAGGAGVSPALSLPLRAPRPLCVLAEIPDRDQSRRLAPRRRPANHRRPPPRLRRRLGAWRHGLRRPTVARPAPGPTTPQWPAPAAA